MDDLPRIPDAEHPVQVLTEAECRDLLAGAQLGRLALSHRNEPDIFPVNFWTHGSAFLVHGPQDVRAAVGRSGRHVVLEADGRESGTVWSVMAKGTVRELDRPEELEAVRQRQLRAWILAPDSAFLELSPDKITGRRIAVGPEERY
ncbi:pyridoxamine 5'-phosphate oxidase family protein [Arthrobacter sp. USHLN218]|uniref:pyridoxamine 5'-phosphate oxidase family protein n=1 Tax=Arthrobacter sp. USHLN218 TaxID=3081232 RepID=UPI003019C485